MLANHQTTIIGNSTDIYISPASSNTEIRADIQVGEYTAIRLWGQILNANQQPVPNALVKLVKTVGASDTPQYQGIAHTTSDCEGFYQFDICSNQEAWYKILVGKSTTGKEIIIDDTNEDCPDHI